ncbi:universal stress protein [Aquimarina litoralis]|uniref:universal stress protein n=1 Tax=Aquimarina litoralis TaxID=584605 RepID=UPI001C55B7C7|nr:universal stress protein [Aquimarina litoralis]MBW1298922.1 universal stress protein [Aquimarina litoralis]
MKTILIPVDFSETSAIALEVAANIAKRNKAKIILTHMAGVEDSLHKKPNDFEEAIYYSKLIGKKMEDFIDVPFLKGILIESVLQKHVSFKSISQLAIEVNASLIVMGSQGKGTVPFFSGSNAEKVVRSSETPVLVIKDNEPQFSPERLLYVSDFQLETVNAYHRIIEAATMLGSRIEFLYVNTPGSSFKSSYEIDQTLLKFFKEVKRRDPISAINMVHRYSDYSVEKGIMNYTSLRETDIIAIATHGRQGLSHWLKGSISEDVANHASKPVLTVKM